MKTHEMTDAHIAKMRKSELRATLHKLNPFAGYDGGYGTSLSVKALRVAMTAYRDSDKRSHDAKRARELSESEQTLHDALLSRGYTHVPSKAHNARDIVDASGAVVYTGSASETWAWLRRRDRAAKRASKRAS